MKKLPIFLSLLAALAGCTDKADAPAPAPAPQAAAKSADFTQLPAGQRGALNNGQYMVIGDVVLSNNGNVGLFMQGDGNVVLYETNAAGTPIRALWSAGTNGSGGDLLAMQTDNNLVLYDTDVVPARAVWNTRTAGRGRPNEGTLYVGFNNSTSLILALPGTSALFLYPLLQYPIF